nr:DUF2339 domain-containing protein [Paenibacillus phyllosphaerae]
MNISDRIEGLERRVSELEHEVAELKRSQGSAAPVFKQGLAAPLSAAAPNLATSPHKLEEAAYPGVHAKPAAKDWEHLITRVWLPRVFMFVLLIGIIWGFKAASDGGILTEPFRVILGYLASGALIFFGFRQHKSDRPLLAQVLLGGSIGVLMLTTFAAHYLFGFVGDSAAFALNIVWVALGLWFSTRFHAQALGVLASAAGVLVPFLIRTSHDQSTLFVAYETLLFVSFMIVALRRRFVALFYVAFILLHLALAIHGLTSDQSGSAIAIGVLIQQLVLLGTVLGFRRLGKHQTGILLASFAVTTLWFKIELSDFWFNLSLILFFAGYAAIAYVSWKKKSDLLPYALTIAAYSLLFYLMNTIDSEYLIGLVLMEGFVAIWLGYVIRSNWQKVSGLIIYILGSIGASAILAEGMDAFLSSSLFIWLALLGTLIGLSQVSAVYAGLEQAQLRKVAYYGIGLLLLGFLSDATQVQAQGYNLNMQHLLLSAVWVIYAIVLIVAGVRIGKKQVRMAGVILLFLTLLKVIFFDLPAVSLMIKAVLFIGLGGVGVLLSRLMYTKK